MAKLGKTLEAYYDDVRKEGVPDHIKQLLQQFDERQDLERRDIARQDLKDKEPS